MMLKILIVAALLSLGQCKADPYCDALTDETPEVIWYYADLEQEFVQLDKYLQENVASTDKLVNANWAGEYVKERQKAAPRCSNQEDNVRKALHALSELKIHVQEKRACSQSSFRGLLKVIVPTQCRSHTKRPEERSRLEQVIYDFAAEHAKICAPKYLDRFEEEYAEVDNETKEIVSKLFTPEIEKKTLANLTHISEDTNILNVGLNRSVLYQIPIRDILMRVESFAPLKEQEMFSPELDRFVNVKFLPTPDKFGSELVQKYVIKPCRRFKGLMSEVFKPARLDMFLDADQWMTKAAEDKIKTSEQFRKAWHDFRLCELLVSNEDEDVVEMFKDVAYPED